MDTKPTKEVTKEQLISMMVGRDMSEMFQRERFELSDEIVLEIKHFTREGNIKILILLYVKVKSLVSQDWLVLVVQK